MDDADGSRRGVAAVEGYLLWQAEIADVRRRAEEFTARMPWLTTAQRHEVERVYTEEQLEASRTTVRRIAARCRELRDEYTREYARLRSRVLLAVVVAVCAALATAVGAVAAVLSAGP